MIGEGNLNFDYSKFQLLTVCYSEEMRTLSVNDMIVCLVLAEREGEKVYGYILPKTTGLSLQKIYPILNKLRKNKVISHQIEEGGGAHRAVYEITPPMKLRLSVELKKAYNNGVLANNDKFEIKYDKLAERVEKII